MIAAARPRWSRYRHSPSANAREAVNGDKKESQRQDLCRHLSPQSTLKPLMLRVIIAAPHKLSGDSSTQALIRIFELRQFGWQHRKDRRHSTEGDLPELLEQFLVVQEAPLGALSITATLRSGTTRSSRSATKRPGAMRSTDTRAA